MGPPVCSVSQLDYFTCQGDHNPSPWAPPTSDGCKQPWYWWVSLLGLGRYPLSETSRTRTSRMEEFPSHIRLRWILTPHRCSPERICMWFSCESDLPPRPQVKWILRCLPERTKNPSPWHRGGLVSHADASPPQAHSDSMSCFLPASQHLESQEKQHKFYEYVHATVNLHFLYKWLKCKRRETY